MTRQILMKIQLWRSIEGAIGVVRCTITVYDVLFVFVAEGFPICSLCDS